MTKWGLSRQKVESQLADLQYRIAELESNIEATNSHQSQRYGSARPSSAGLLRDPEGQTNHLAAVRIQPREIPCPVPGCKRRAQLCGQATDRPYFRCHHHGFVVTLADLRELAMRIPSRRSKCGFRRDGYGSREPSASTG